MHGGQLVIAAIVGGLMGFACGLIPFRAASERKQHALAIASMITCVLVGLLGGCILALPTAFVFKWIAMAAGEALSDFSGNQAAFSGDSDRPRRRSQNDSTADSTPALPYTILGTAVVCKRCGKACSKVNGGPPAACPHCDRRFSDTREAVPRVYPRAKRASAEPDEEPVLLERA